jgi:hypothetical protein
MLYYAIFLLPRNAAINPSAFQYVIDVCTASGGNSEKTQAKKRMVGKGFFRFSGACQNLDANVLACQRARAATTRITTMYAISDAGMMPLAKY